MAWPWVWKVISERARDRGTQLALPCLREGGGAGLGFSQTSLLRRMRPLWSAPRGHLMLPPAQCLFLLLSATFPRVTCLSFSGQEAGRG